MQHSVTSSLSRLEVPGASAAEEKAWTIVERAFAEYRPQPRPRRGLVRVSVVVAAVAVAAGAVVSPTGRAVVDRVREVVGVERAQPALFRLPAPGRLLVSSDAGVWVVQENGAKRLLGRYREASWSPFGRFVVAARHNELAALEPDGDVRWTLARPNVRFPRWTGTAADTRIAYADRTGIRVVAGDGTSDRLLAPAEAGPVAWRPGTRHVLAYLSASEVRAQDADTGRVVFRANNGSPADGPVALEWSTDGERLLVVSNGTMRIFGPRGELVAQSRAGGGSIIDATFVPGTRRILVARSVGAQSVVSELGTDRSVFSGTGVFDEIAVSPDGRWLVVEWRTADQWVFVRVAGPHTIRAAAGIADQFRGTPGIAGWCCP